MSKGRSSPSRTPSVEGKNRRLKADIFERIEMVEFVENYGAKIRAMREKLGLTREELGNLVREKASYIKKIENEEVKPSIQLARALERVLKIKILEEVKKDYEVFSDLAAPTKSGSRTITLADMVDVESLFKSEKKTK